MNFFQQQDNARKNTRLLVLLFGFAVLSLVVLTNILLLLFPWANDFSSVQTSQGTPLQCLRHSQCHFLELFWQPMLYISLSVMAVIALVSLYKWVRLSAGGKTIAEMMGGRQVKASTSDPAERRYLNIVEEMAIASNMPVPAIYVLDNEEGINAFAAGYSPRDAVVAVTAGTLKAMNRDELQGVIAHEFSHIFNGDMRMNMKLIAVLHGIMFITQLGYILMRTGTGFGRKRRSGRGQNDIRFTLGMLSLGGGLLLIGALGTLFGNLIKAAIGRQREFLADASAVQFTRNPAGIANALKKIGGRDHGSIIHKAESVEISHMFFSSGVTLMQSLFSTHPPLDVRIRKIEPRWDGQYISPGSLKQDQDTVRNSDSESEAKQHRKEQAAVLGAVLVTSTAQAADSHANLVGQEEYEQGSLHTPLGAAAAIACLLLPVEEKARHAYLVAIEKAWSELHKEIQDSLFLDTQRQDFLHIVELAISALRELDEKDYKRFKSLLIQLIKADKRIDLYEWALYNLLTAYLAPHFDKPDVPRAHYSKVAEVRNEIMQVFSVFVRETGQNDQTKKKAYIRACDTCGIYGVAGEDLPEVSMTKFAQAVKILAQCQPLLKSRFMKALVNAAMCDGELESIEKNTLFAIAATIDSPLSTPLLSELGL